MIKQFSRKDWFCPRWLTLAKVGVITCASYSKRYNKLDLPFRNGFSFFFLISWFLKYMLGIIPPINHLSDTYDSQISTTKQMSLEIPFYCSQLVNRKICTLRAYLVRYALTHLHGCFSRLLNCTNGTQSRNAPHIF